MLSPSDAALNAAIAAMPAKAGKAMQRFRVELEKLRATASDLQGEVSSMYGVADRMSGHPNFGDGGISGAGVIGPRHGDVAKLMQKLLRDIHGGIAAGEAALIEVAERYAAADSQGEKRMKDAGERALEDEGFDEHEEKKVSG